MRGAHGSVGWLALATLFVPSASASAQDPRTMPPDSWLEIPDTHLRDVAPPAEFAALSGIEGVSAVTDHWSGAALDSRRSRLIVWGGGGAGYYGNELYAFDLATLSWSRLTDPSLAAYRGEPECSDPLPDGAPPPRSTYSGLAYLEHVDRFFGLGGGGPCGGCGMPLPWSYDFAGSGWSSHPPPALAPATSCGNVAVYDPTTTLLYWGEPAIDGGSVGLWSYDITRDAWSHLANDPSDDPFYAQTGAIDTLRRQLVFAGLGMDSGPGGLFSYPLDGAPMVREVWAWRGTAGEAITRASGPGFDYDPTRDLFVAWIGSLDAVDTPAYILDPGDRTWTISSAPGAPRAGLNGTYGRWRYVPSVDAFIVVTGVDANVFFYKPPGAAVVPADAGTPLDGGANIIDAAIAAGDARTSLDAQSSDLMAHFRGSSIASCRIGDRRAAPGSLAGTVVLAAISIAHRRRPSRAGARSHERWR